MIRLPLTTDTDEQAKPTYWRSLDELSGSASFHADVAREFPEQAGLLDDPVSRRRFLSLIGASLALAGVSGCGRSAPDKIIPRVRQPEDTIPGKAKYYATAMPHPGGAVGILVESHEGRPTKIEGNPLHPASLGATSIFEQASILDLYDPDRAKVVKHNGQVMGWDDALAGIEKELAPVFAKQGEGFALLTGHINSPTLAWQIQELMKALPKAKWYTHEPGVSNTQHEASKRVFGQALEFVYDIEKADVIVALDSDFLASGPNHLRYSRQFARRRNPDGKMNRLYSVESMPTPTGMMADRRLPMTPWQIEKLLRLWSSGQPIDTFFKEPAVIAFVDEMKRDLDGKAGRVVLIAGHYLSSAAHECAMVLNVKHGSFASTMQAISPVDARSELGLSELCQAIDRREVAAIAMLAVNPVYASPVAVQFAGRLKTIQNRVCLSSHEDETSTLCKWHLPAAHYLESWSDSRGVDGAIGIIQPLIAPLYDGRSSHFVVQSLIGMATKDKATTDDREIVREYWRRNHGADKFEELWRNSVHDGVVEGSRAKPHAARIVAGWSLANGQPLTNDLELILRPDPTIGDGRFANNAWLQELPKPLTKLAWDNAAIISPAMAKELGITPREGPHGGSHGELITVLVDLSYRGTTLSAPAYVLPGHPDRAVTLHLGNGRIEAGRAGNGVGISGFAIQSVGDPWGGPGLTIKRTGNPFTLACTQSQHSMESRDLARLTTLAAFTEDPSCAPHQNHAHHGHNPPVEGFHAHELYTNPQTQGPYQWGMAVDLNVCHGCNACVIACQAENNIPVVGKEMITRGREMHWLRIDRYFVGDESNPQAVHMPVMCQHCENAPCEVVCPVEATSHSPDGLNEMTYNRCVGTRYCANNCPYKVRRFNFLQYTDYATESLKLQRNPDVSVRVRGVMEKCTYCVQRIREAEINAKVQHRAIADGDIVTACQAACPTEAIVFGNIADANSRVSKLKSQQRNYGILTELNTKPRTTYLAAVRNPWNGS